MLRALRARREELEEKEGGFTLIELLIVVIILAILATIVVFSVTGLTNNSSKTACATTAKTVDTALEAYFAQNNTPAATIGALVTGGFLHADSNFTTTSGTAVTVLDNGGKTQYVVTLTPGTTDAGTISATLGTSSTVCGT